MNKSKPDSYSQKLKECRLDPISDPLIPGIGEPYPFSSGFSTGEVLEKALAWQQELAARVREEQEQSGIPFEERTERANQLVNLAAEVTMAVRALSVAFPDVFAAVASKKGTFPVNIPAHPEERKNIIRWLSETLALGSKHELKLRGRKTFSREPFANRVLLYYMRRIKMRAIEQARLRFQDPWLLSSGLTIEEKLTLHAPLSKATARKWMKVIWAHLLADCPAPEKHERLRQFGAHRGEKTRAAFGEASPKTGEADIRAGIQDALLKYLLRMLTDK